MKRTVLAGAAVILLSGGTAFAQGYATPTASGTASGFVTNDPTAAPPGFAPPTFTGEGQGPWGSPSQQGEHIETNGSTISLFPPTDTPTG